jgi:predicted kinase
VTALAGRIAAFHRAAAPAPSLARSGSRRTADVLAINERALLTGAVVLGEAAVRRLIDASRAAWQRVAPLLDARQAAGRVRHCHGDLHLRNIVAIDGVPTLFDCLEFDDDMATIDVLYDLAFALMDLARQGLGALANRLLNEWLWRVGEVEGASHEEALALLPMFLARRAVIRAYVDSAVTAVSGADNAPARAYQKAALAFLQPAPPRLVAIGGLSGSGKTTLALKLAPEIGRLPGAVVVRTDVERKRQAGIPLEERMPDGSYSPEASARIYAAFMARAERVLRAGHSVVLDAVFARPDERAAAEALARKVGVPFQGIWLDVPKDVAQQRVTARKGDASDATASVVERQFGYDLGAIDWERR